MLDLVQMVEHLFLKVGGSRVVVVALDQFKPLDRFRSGM